jgi:hypothetical protein
MLFGGEVKDATLIDLQSLPQIFSNFISGLWTSSGDMNVV